MRSSIGRPANFEHGLRDAFGDRTQPGALASGHDHRNIRLGSGTDQVAQEMNGDEPAVLIKHGHMLEGARLHDVEDRGAVDVRRDRKKIAVHHGRGRHIERAPGQQSPANIAVGNQPDNTAGFVTDQDHLTTVGIDRQQRIANGRAVRDDNSRKIGRSRRSSLGAFDHQCETRRVLSPTLYELTPTLRLLNPEYKSLICSSDEKRQVPVFANGPSVRSR